MLRTVSLAVVGCLLVAAPAPADDAAAQVEKAWLTQLAMRQSARRGKAPAAPAAPKGLAYPIDEALARGRRLLARRRGEGVDVAAHARALQDAAKKATALAADAPEETQRALYLEARWIVRRLVLADQLLDFDRLLFVKRYTYRSFPMGRHGGGLAKGRTSWRLSEPGGGGWGPVRAANSSRWMPSATAYW